MIRLAFRATAKVRPDGSLRTHHPLETQRAQREATCAKCEWFQRETKRCCQPNGREWKVCYSNPARIEPWKWLVSCPQWSLATRVQAEDSRGKEVHQHKDA